MPGNIQPAVPEFVMPMSLAAAFEEVHHLDVFIDEYADGRSTRRALADNDRHVFRLSRPLTDALLDDLRGFYVLYARFGHAFYFYNVRETQPLFSWDPTGADVIGRYTVVWEGGWQETLNVGLHSSSFVLREVD